TTRAPAIARRSGELMSAVLRDEGNGSLWAVMATGYNHAPRAERNSVSTRVEPVLGLEPRGVREDSARVPADEHQHDEEVPMMPSCRRLLTNRVARVTLLALLLSPPLTALVQSQGQGPPATETSPSQKWEKDIQAFEAADQ